MDRRLFRLAAPVVVGGILLAGAAGPAFAAKVVLQSKSPYWDVGVNDPVLSQMCAIGQFNQKSINTYVARFTGDEGSGVLGIAKGNGVNLYDPKHAAKKNEDYFFLGDGSSSCAVYVGGRKPPPKPGDKKPGPPGANTAAAAAPGTTAAPKAPALTTPAPPTPPSGANGG